MNPFESYLHEVHDIRRSQSGVAETSYYPAISNLFNAIGSDLKPKVSCIINPANKGAGIPDGGFFTLDQFPKSSPQVFDGKLTPSRGVLEVKPAHAKVDNIAQSEQVDRYLGSYGQVLVTNLWDFQLVGKDVAGNKINLERYSLAKDDAEFWANAAHPQTFAREQEDRFADYLKRVLLRRSPVGSPQDLAWIMASYAREALARVENSQIPGVKQLKEALEQALGIRFKEEKGYHFFHSTLVQTLFYGLFSSWVFWARELPLGDIYSRFDWKSAQWSLHVPMIRNLFHQVADPARLNPLGLVELLDWTTQVLNRVDRMAFFAKFEEKHAVQYFYEPFLEAFDPSLRKEMGVWYTPPEVVRYMVERVDRVLRTELDLPDGLADSRVYVLDPCCGTGAFLVEVLDRIARTLQEKGQDGLMGEDLKQAAINRVFGFEILPAPYVVAHLQLGLALARHGTNLRIHPPERAGVYLTNALTGWTPPTGEKQIFFFPELEDEYDAAEKVKQKKPILVVIGNPPYNAFAGVSPDEEEGLVEPYKQGLIKDWKIKKFNLDDLYVRFFRLAERRVADMTGKGVVCFISNFSYLSDSSYVVMRKRLLDKFERVWVDCLNGDSRQTGKLTPEGKPDPSIFSTKYNREGIRVGTSIGLFVKTGRGENQAIFFRSLWGTEKIHELTRNSKDESFIYQYQQTEPQRDNRFSFHPLRVSAQYRDWPTLPDLCIQKPNNGLMEKRGGALIDIDKDALQDRIEAYFNSNISFEHLATFKTGLTQKAADFDPVNTRIKALATAKFSKSYIHKYLVRPFDARYCYYTEIQTLWNRCRKPLYKQYVDGSAFIISRPMGVAHPEGSPIFYTKLLGDNDFQRGHAYFFAIKLNRIGALSGNKDDQHSLGDPDITPIANISSQMHAYLSTIGTPPLDVSLENIDLPWMHALSIGFSPTYLSENADGIRSDWPRIPLPNTLARLQTSAELGRRIAALLSSEESVSGVTAAPLSPLYRQLGPTVSLKGAQLDPSAGHLDVTAGWGHLGKNAVTMPGRGKLTLRDYTAEEMEAIQEESQSLGITEAEALARLGRKTLDIHLNEDVIWRNIPEKVWEYFIGGYQVIKKWLSYREKDVLGRGLTSEEARHVTDTARRLAALRLMEPELDANYQEVVKDTFDWSKA